MIKLYTIGFTEKSAKKFFELLEQNQVRKIIDTRINNTSQLSGFAKGKDLSFFAKRIANIGYEHKLNFAPTKELLRQYRKKEISWDEYTKEYLQLLDARHIKEATNFESLHESCLLCSEHSPELCHRKLLAEYLQEINPDIQIIHLQ
ncbi:MAG: DUF488 domain-containing protein [Anaerolineae bacterium]|nr:DUF488 domain-containing protein [Anaerolineae bacterium]